jgi:hypothetical protein
LFQIEYARAKRDKVTAYFFPSWLYLAGAGIVFLLLLAIKHSEVVSTKNNLAGTNAFHSSVLAGTNNFYHDQLKGFTNQIRETNIFYTIELTDLTDRLATANAEHSNMVILFRVATNKMEQDDNFRLRHILIINWAQQAFTNQDDYAAIQLLNMGFSLDANFATVMWPVYDVSCLMTNPTTETKQAFYEKLSRRLDEDSVNKNILRLEGEHIFWMKKNRVLPPDLKSNLDQANDYIWNALKRTNQYSPPSP